jgi:hypothetical protein
VPHNCEMPISFEPRNRDLCFLPATHHGRREGDGQEWFYCGFHADEISRSAPDVTVTPLPHAEFVHAETGELSGVVEREPSDGRFHAWSLRWVPPRSRSPVRYLGVFDSREEAERQVLAEG